MMLSDERQMILKIKQLSDEEKKDMGEKLDRWTISRIEACRTKKFVGGVGITVKDLEYCNTDRILMDNVFLYYYLLGMKLSYTLYSEKYPEDDTDEPCGIYSEVRAEGYQYNGEPFIIACVVTKEEFDELYRDIVVEPKQGVSHVNTGVSD